MLVFYFTIPFMLVGIAIAVVPLVWAIRNPEPRLRPARVRARSRATSGRIAA